MVKELLILEVLQLKCNHPLKYIADLYTEHMLHSYNVHRRYGIQFQNDSYHAVPMTSDLQQNKQSDCVM